MRTNAQIKFLHYPLLILMTQVFLYLFSLLDRNNLKLHNIFVTPKMVKKINEP